MMQQLHKIFIIVLLILTTISSMANANSKTHEEAEIQIEEEDNPLQNDEIPASSWWDLNGWQAWLMNNVANINDNINYFYEQLSSVEQSSSGNAFSWQKIQDNIANFYSDLHSSGDSNYEKLKPSKKSENSSNKSDKKDSNTEANNSGARIDNSIKNQDRSPVNNNTKIENETNHSANAAENHVVHDTPIKNPVKNHSKVLLPVTQVSIISDNGEERLNGDEFLDNIVKPNVNKTNQIMNQPVISINNINFKLDSLFMSENALTK